MAQVERHITPHLEAGQTAPNDSFGANYTLSSGHEASVSYYGKNGNVKAGELSPTQVAILFFREVFPANQSVQKLSITKTVKVGGTKYTTDRYYDFCFPLGMFVSSYMHNGSTRYYKADGVSISYEEYRVIADEWCARRDAERQAEEQEKQRRRDEGQAARLDKIAEMDPREAHALLIRLAEWWNREEEVFSKPGMGGTIDELLTALTGIDSNNL